MQLVFHVVQTKAGSLLSFISYENRNVYKTSKSFRMAHSLGTSPKNMVDKYWRKDSQAQDKINKSATNKEAQKNNEKNATEMKRKTFHADEQRSWKVSTKIKFFFLEIEKSPKQEMNADEDVANWQQTGMLINKMWHAHTHTKPNSGTVSSAELEGAIKCHVCSKDKHRRRHYQFIVKAKQCWENRSKKGNISHTQHHKTVKMLKVAAAYKITKHKIETATKSTNGAKEPRGSALYDYHWERLKSKLQCKNCLHLRNSRRHFIFGYQFSVSLHLNLNASNGAIRNDFTSGVRLGKWRTNYRQKEKKKKIRIISKLVLIFSLKSLENEKWWKKSVEFSSFHRLFDLCSCCLRDLGNSSLPIFNFNV